ncbi:MAG: serine-type D-Ala-D-Ala carboxypeptidase [Legionellales bacterium RIFCSPHIGHO2_12_FULL_37_14]|nr:MAG: serine-type D-Ala-D-Ala carboxypeptidase [Legionellales bacterium RIFCSPHIGHO2_12_FULL_37_14]
MMNKVGYLGVFLLSFSSAAFAEDAPLANNPRPKVEISRPMIVPTAPTINASAYILLDANTGAVITAKDSKRRLPPASLTKIMTLYVISDALYRHQINLNDKVHVSVQAWKAEGSRMFIKEGDEVAVEDLIKGIIVDSGNDSCVAMAEYVGGSEPGFTDLMNQQAKNLHLEDSHFTDSTGLPNKDLYTTAYDLAQLSRALINRFPEYYPWYQQKWFTYNNIRQPNRNRLLWRNSNVDGIKTGHTNDAGFCLVSSAKQGSMRLISVVLGSPSDKVRADDSERLLNYGFRFYENVTLFNAKQVVKEALIYKGALKTFPVGSFNPIVVTVPKGQASNIQLTTKLASVIKAPIKANTKVGELIVSLDNKPINTFPLYALENVAKGGLLTRMKDSIRLWWS